MNCPKCLFGVIDYFYYEWIFLKCQENQKAWKPFKIKGFQAFDNNSFKKVILRFIPFF
ncbi:hypothetical protein ELI_1849 [Eubacterium callanderi]|uniref:Uncharacterized protein n=1 Tax=Eubacterium callanderi TaxID=53442 RepID=E3GK80_9FIRM|nr:hypothetical protein ELI_1849 [Eubacterium callanderi]